MKTNNSGYANCCGSSGADGYSNYAYGANGEDKAYSNQAGNFDLPLNASGDNKGAKALDVAGYATMKLDNNMPAVATALGQSPSTSRDKLGAMLAAMYKSNPIKFFATLKSVPYNPNANNYTTDKNFVAKITDQLNNLNK